MRSVLLRSKPLYAIQTEAKMPINWCLVVLAVAALVFSGCKKQRSPELQRFLDKYNQIEEEMTEEEVDEILDGYPSYASKLDRQYHGQTGKPLKRNSAFEKTYSNKPGATEGDYCIIVYFDADGRVVGKRIAEIVS